MTKRIGNVVMIEVEPDQTCARCKQPQECRPAGANGEQLCYYCTTPGEREAYTRRLFATGREN